MPPTEVTLSDLQQLAEKHRRSIGAKLEELCGLMDLAVADGFQVGWDVSPGPTRRMQVKSISMQLVLEPRK